MKVLVMIKGSGADEERFTPAKMAPEAVEAMFAAMASYNEKLANAGILLDGAGLLPSSAGAKVVFEGGTTSVVDGPFTEAKEIIGGYWIWQVNSLEEAVEWAKQCPTDPNGVRQVLEIRPYAEEEDFGEGYTPEIKEREARLAEQIRAQREKA